MNQQPMHQPMNAPQMQQPMQQPMQAPQAQQRIYCGKGKEKQLPYGPILEAAICLDNIPQEHTFINEHDGKRYVKVKICRMKEPDNYGKTHFVEVDTWKPQSQQYPAQPAPPQQAFGAHPNYQPPQQPQMQQPMQQPGLPSQQQMQQSQMNYGVPQQAPNQGGHGH